VSEPTTYTLEVPGAVLRYDVRPATTETGEPPLMLIGSPMDASGFVSLVPLFADRTIVTYDPRGVSRSERTDGAIRATPDEHADDLHRIIAAVGLGPVDLLASSGGAVNALVLVAKHPEDVRTLVAHEPPAVQALPDREEALAASRAIHDTYQHDGLGPAMAMFLALISLKGPVPADFADRALDPSAFGLPTEDDGCRDDALLGANIISCTHYEHDFDALRAASTRVVLAAGVESEGELAHRGALAVAERLGTDAVIFPSHHGGFLGGEFGMKGDPEGFAAALRDVLTQVPTA
jgi:pimeloyl-ACP methyl ester carboxylesterase